MTVFLAPTPVIDWDSAGVLAFAHQLGRGRTSDADIVRGCFAWVRDEVRHTLDHGLDVITCSASDVLAERSGFCYSKSHLLAALLRAHGIPAGFVYQRLALDDRGSAFCLHGLNAVWLRDCGWVRLDARGARHDLRAEFDPPREVLPFACVVPGEQLFPGVFAEPLPLVVDALRRFRTRQELAAHLPDATSLETPSVRDSGMRAGA